jgi:2-polyprenyl-6-methoxyphenol hydroxylase-like FAD-dependent oxidoreductase
MASNKDFKVIIAGGGIAGLTLANMLEKFDIQYVLLEAYSAIAPPVGASIGLVPNGLRIMDQIAAMRPSLDSLMNTSTRDTSGIVTGRLCLRCLFYSNI